MRLLKTWNVFPRSQWVKNVQLVNVSALSFDHFPKTT